MVQLLRGGKCSLTKLQYHVLADLHATSRWQEDVYKQLHSHPELSFQETRTAALAASKLKELVTKWSKGPKSHF